MSYSFRQNRVFAVESLIIIFFFKKKKHLLICRIYVKNVKYIFYNNGFSGYWEVNLIKSFCIAHLSDLHISNKEDPSLERVRNALINDLTNLINTNGLSLDAVAITGDIIDRGHQKSFTTAKDFCDKLLSELKLEQEKLLIVPGNHDIPRRDAVSIFLKNIKEDDFQDEAKSEEHWETLGARFKNYNEFAKSFMFNDSFHEGMFGGALKDVYTSCGIIRFVLLNSAWAACGRDDYGNLFIGRWQLESLKEISSDLPQADLTIALTHHPFVWFCKSEKELLQEFLSNDQYLPVDAVLHGHIHSGSIDITSNPDSSLVCLVSGMGYPEIEKRETGLPKLSKCRYAIYRFDVEEGSLEVWLRTTREDGVFVADTLLYKAGKENGNFTIPFKKLSSQQESIITKKITPVNLELDPVPLITDWVGRKDEINLLLDPNLRAASITGVGGQGKTYLAAEILRCYARGENPRYEVGIWVDCRELADSIHLKIIQLLEVLSNGKESAPLYRDEKPEDTAKRFLCHLKSRSTMIVFDNIDAYINVDAECPKIEFKSIVDIILNNEHMSFVIFTCRPPFNDSRGSFCHIQLVGLSQSDGVEFFRKRNIEMKGKNDEIYCKQLVSLTNGHPWWLGLIAGQVASKHDDLKHCVERFSRGEAPASGAIKEYFKGIWNQIGKHEQQLLRYLIEAPRPLTENEICQAVQDFGPSKTRKHIRKLERLGLLGRHEDSLMNELFYQIHPLVREYIHETYSTSAQKRYVFGVLCLFLPTTMVNNLFNETTGLDNDSNLMAPKKLVESVETCLNSRNYEQGFYLLEHFYEILYNNGSHHQFYSLTCRVLDSVNWNKVRITKRSKGKLLLFLTIQGMIKINKIQRCDSYLNRFESLVEPNSIDYLDYLNLASFIAWEKGRYKDALSLTGEYDVLVGKFNAVISYNYSVLQIRALALRDLGELAQSLSIFRQIDMENKEYNATTPGNIACCLIKLKQYNEAESLLRKSLRILKIETDYISCTNTGYAYLWLAEAMYEQGKYIDANAFLLLAKEVWSEYAPGLLSKVNELENMLVNSENDEPVSLQEAREIERQFLDFNSYALQMPALKIEEDAS